MRSFPIKVEAIAHLSEADCKLGAFIKKRGRIMRSVFHSPFECLVSCIVAQQITSRAAENIFARIKAQSGVVDAENILSLGESKLCACGISLKKSKTILALAQAFSCGELSESAFAKMSDCEIEKVLTSFTGIGAWTVEMFLIFALKRSDIFSIKDFGIRKGFSLLHSRGDIRKYKRLYSPYGTTASIYLWELASSV